MSVYLKSGMVGCRTGNRGLRYVHVHGLPIDDNGHEAAGLLEVTRACQYLNLRAGGE